MFRKIQYIPAHNLKSQEWLDKIYKLTEQQKMMINESKSKTMVFNFTDKYKFIPRLNINNNAVEVIDSTRYLVQS